MAHQIHAIEMMSDHRSGTTMSVGIVNGGTFVNVVPIECRAEVLAVFPTREAFDSIAAFMSSLKPVNADVTITVEPGPVRPLFEPGAETLALYSRAEEIARSIGFVPGHGSRPIPHSRGVSWNRGSLSRLPETRGSTAGHGHTIRESAIRKICVAGSSGEFSRRGVPELRAPANGRYEAEPRRTTSPRGHKRSAPDRSPGL